MTGRELIHLVSIIKQGKPISLQCKKLVIRRNNSNIVIIFRTFFLLANYNHSSTDTKYSNLFQVSRSKLVPSISPFCIH